MEGVVVGCPKEVTDLTSSPADWVARLNSLRALPSDCPSSGSRLGPKTTSATNRTMTM